jgi:hypothetical protein
MGERKLQELLPRDPKPEVRGGGRNGGWEAQVTYQVNKGHHDQFPPTPAGRVLLRKGFQIGFCEIRNSFLLLAKYNFCSLANFYSGIIFCG